MERTNFWTTVAASSARDDWRTPLDLYRAVSRTWGPFTLDAAASDANHLAPAWYTVDDNALEQDWPGTVWVNPPYGRELARWADKAISEVRAGHSERVVMLVPARPDTNWSRRLANAGQSVYLPGRLNFTDPQTGLTGDRAPFPSALYVLGSARRAVALRCSACRSIFFARSHARTCSVRCRVASHRG